MAPNIKGLALACCLLFAAISSISAAGLGRRGILSQKTTQHEGHDDHDHDDHDQDHSSSMGGPSSGSSMPTPMPNGGGLLGSVLGGTIGGALDASLGTSQWNPTHPGFGGDDHDDHDDHDHDHDHIWQQPPNNNWQPNNGNNGGNGGWAPPPNNGGWAPHPTMVVGPPTQQWRELDTSTKWRQWLDAVWWLQPAPCQPNGGNWNPGNNGGGWTPPNNNWTPPPGYYPPAGWQPPPGWTPPPPGSNWTPPPNWGWQYYPCACVNNQCIRGSGSIIGIDKCSLGNMGSCTPVGGSQCTEAFQDYLLPGQWKKCCTM